MDKLNPFASLGVAIREFPTSTWSADHHIAMIRVKRSEQGEFMAGYLKSGYGQKDLLENRRGGGELGLGWDNIHDTPSPELSNKEANQMLNEIESQLSVCYSIEEAVEHTIKKAQAMRQSILREAFEGRL